MLKHEKKICIPITMLRKIKQRNKEHIESCEEYLLELKKVEQKLFELSLNERNKTKVLKND